MVDISIIVPVYNASVFINTKLVCLLDESKLNYELIYVDDGSTDDSLELIKELALNNENVKHFSQINKGVSSARNLGLLNATGKYVYFLDVDDEVFLPGLIALKNSVEELHKDIYVFPFDIKRGGSTIEEAIYPIQRPEELLYRYFLRKQRLHLCAMVFSKELLELANISFKEGVRYGEDTAFFLVAIKQARTVGIATKKLYSYVLNESSVMNNRHSLHRFDALYSLISISKHFSTYREKLLFQWFVFTVMAKTYKVLNDEHPEYKFHFRRYKQSLNSIALGPVNFFPLSLFKLILKRR